MSVDFFGRPGARRRWIVFSRNESILDVQHFGALISYVNGYGALLIIHLWNWTLYIGPQWETSS